MTDQNRKIFLAAGVTALLTLLWLIFSPWGIISYFRLKRELVEIKAGNLELTATNAKMQSEITRLKTDSTYLEKVARDKYNLLRKNEVVFQTPPPKKKEKHGD